MTSDRKDERVAVVTGANGGLGSALVNRLLRDHGCVLSLDRNFDRPTFDREVHVTQDLASPEGVRQAIDAVAGAVGHVDVLVNCAGVFEADATGPEGWDVFERLLTHNVLSMAMLTLGLDQLLRAGASVLNIASTDGVVASAGQSCEVGVSHDVLYASSKGAVITFTKALAMKWASRGIRVNCVSPTVFESPMTTTLLAEPGKRAQIESCLPLGVIPTADQVAESCLYLLHLPFTTGHNLTVDGGYLCQ